MSLINIYLTETPLTSTKNKYIDKNYLFKLRNGCKRKGAFYNLHDSSEKSILLSTENKFLNYDYVPRVKKKKKMYIPPEPCQSIGRPLSVTGNDAVDYMLDQESAVIFGGTSIQARERSLSREQEEVNTANSLCFGSSPAFTGSLSREQKEVNTANSLCFGSSPAFTGFRMPEAVTLNFHKKSAFQVNMRASILKAQAAPFAFSGAASPPLYRRAPSSLPETIIKEMPSYKLETLQLLEKSEREYFTSTFENLNEERTYNIKSKKLKLLNIVSMALMYSSNLRDKEDTYRIVLQKAVDDVRLVDPEFILKIALYARQDLQIRAVTNFLLSYAAVHNNTRIFLEKYFSSSIVLPTDWIEVAEYFQLLSDEEKKQPFPAALRRAMKKAFPKFDEYQLAKYNRNKTKKKKIEKKVIQDNVTEDSAEHIPQNKNFSLKQLIRTLHIEAPAEHVMCLLGKKYPENQKSFELCGLPGSWDPSRAGKRMKLPIPETWEIEISSKGNKSNVWESLIDNNKLPYMAMLRNLKNLILSGISADHHNKVIKYLENKKHVINSRQLPLQFFEAYKAISSLKVSIELNKTEDSLDCDSDKIPFWKKKQLKKTCEKMKTVSEPVVERYMNAISNALEISSLNNLHPIPGKTLIITELSFIDFDQSEKVSSQKNKKINDTCIMMSLMCLKACENCQMKILCGFFTPDEASISSDNFLDDIKNTCESYKQKCNSSTTSKSEFHYHNTSALKHLLNYYLKPQTILSLKLDHIVFLGPSSEPSIIESMKSFLDKYRQIVNSELLYTHVNFSLNNKCFIENSSSEKDVYLCGSSSSLVKFIAERSSGGQLTCVENIDVKYKLPDLKASVESSVNNSLEAATTFPFNYRVPKWHTVRIFISSTFKDMLSERDLLVRYVFPELKRRAASVFVRIAEIDLRWGITEADSSTKRAAELCLIEAQRADLFVGIIGDRYGTIHNFDPSNVPELDWLKDCPAGLSITELEIYAAALKDPDSAKNKAFFYFRNNSFISHVPHMWISHFSPEDADSADKVEKLKNKIKSTHFKVLDGYPCLWAGIFENKPILAGLDVLGATMLEDLWNAVQEIHTSDPFFNEVSEEEMFHENVIDSHSFFVGKKNSCIEKMLKKIKSESGIFVVCGAVGSGKTTIMVNLLENLNNSVVVKFFIGISPRSRNISYMLQYICNCFLIELPVSLQLPDFPDDIVNQFPDIILEASTCTGGRDLILLIDGLEQLELNDQRLDWLPLKLPNRVKLVCSASDSSLAFEVLSERQARGNPVSIEIVPPLQQSDREELVRNYLNYYRKTLDESAFSNNMLKIVTKKESSNPLYLRIACDFLRIYATFDNLMHMLQKLPSTVILVLQEVILQIENEYGSTLVQNALSLLCTAKEGLEDNDIYNILSFLSSVHDMKTLSYNELKEKLTALKPEELLNQVKYCSLMHVLSTFMCGQIRRKSLSLCGTLFEKSVQKFYMNKNFASVSKHLHSVLSAYYHNICDPGNDGKYSGQSGFAIRGLLYHTLNGCLYQELSNLLCNYKFIEAVFREEAGDQLLEYYSSLIYDILPNNQKISREINYQQIYSFYDFVSRNFHVFHRYACLIMQQALNEPSDSFTNLKSEKCSFDSLENLSRNTIVDHRLATISGFIKNITALTSERLQPYVILGSEDGYLKVLDLNARKIVRNIKSHVSAVTCICYAGKNRVCVSSADGTLTLWDSAGFNQIAVLKGHRHNVTSCCADPSHFILYSAGWDNSVRLWSLSDGRSISVIDSFRCPVNCIDHHPLKQQVACGLWNGNIEIWDTLSVQKKLEIPSSFGSVKSLAYTADGFNIISSFIQSEVCIWSSEEGLKMSTLKGHNLPVTIISCSLAENLFISGSDDCTLKVWSSVAQHDFCIISECKNCPISLMEFMSKDMLAVAFQNSEIWVFDINTGIISTKFTLESDVVSSFSTYSKVNFEIEDPEDTQDLEENWFQTSLVFGTNHGQIMVGNILTSSILTVGNLTFKITAIVHNDAGIVCGSAEGDIGLFSYPENEFSKVITGAHRSFITSISICTSDTHPYILSTSNDNILKLWKIHLEEVDVTLHKELPNKHRDGITCSTFYPPTYYGDLSCAEEFRNIYTGSYDNNILNWGSDLKVFKGLQSSVLKVKCSEKFILGCGNDGSLVLWQKSGEILTSIPGIELSSTPLTFHIDENDSKEFEVKFAFVDKDGSIKVRKPFERTYSCSFEGHKKTVTSCCIAGNGEVVSCSLDGSVNLWKLPTDTLNNPFIHTSPVIGLILSAACEFALSSDAQGNLVVWNIDLSQTSPLIYAAKKSYEGGFIRKISWMKNHCFVCAVNQNLDNKEKHFIDILSFETRSSVNLKVNKSYNFESEILSLDSCSVTDSIVVGFKSGEIMVINSTSEKKIKMCHDWILGISLYSRENISDLFCASFVDGRVNLYSISEFLKAKDESQPTPFASYKPPHTNSASSKLISVLYCGSNKMVCCGDMCGNLRIHSKHSLVFSKKIHADSITGICIVGSYIFTSSLDKTVKGWSVTSLKQVCQFHLHVPITCLVTSKANVGEPDSTSCFLLIGTTSGDVHLLKFHSK